MQNQEGNERHQGRNYDYGRLLSVHLLNELYDDLLIGLIQVATGAMTDV